VRDVSMQYVCQISRRRISECRKLSIERLKNFKCRVQFLTPCSWLGFLYRVGVKYCHVSEGYTSYFFSVTVGSSGCRIDQENMSVVQSDHFESGGISFSETSLRLAIARCTDINEYRHLINNRRAGLATCVISRM
jgi:hypothetical protein